LRRVRFATCCVLTLALLSAPHAHAQFRDFKEVEPEALIETPQIYWAVGVVFKDTLVEPPSGRQVQLERERYTQFLTETVGKCYADESIVPRLQVLEFGKEYLFAGTVLQKQGFFRSKYYVVVRDVKPAVITAETEDLSADPRFHQTTITTDQLTDLLSTVEHALFALAEEHNYGPSSLLEDDAPGYEHAMETIRTTVATAEKEYGTTSRELLVRVIRDLLAPSSPDRAAEPATTASEEEEPEQTAAVEREAVLASPDPPTPMDNRWAFDPEPSRPPPVQESSPVERVDVTNATREAMPQAEVEEAPPDMETSSVDGENTPQPEPGSYKLKVSLYDSRLAADAEESSGSNETAGEKKAPPAREVEPAPPPPPVPDFLAETVPIDESEFDTPVSW